MKGDRGPLSWPLCHRAFLSSLPDLSGDLGKPQQSTLNSITLSLPFIRGLFNRQEAFIYQHSTEWRLFILETGCCNLMTVIICCCSRKMKVAENAASRHLSHTKNLKALVNLNEKEKTFGDLLLLSKLKEKQNGPQRNRVQGDGSATAKIAKTRL